MTPKAYDLVTDNFVAGFNGPLLVFVQGGGPGEVAQLSSSLAELPDVAAVAPGPAGGGVQIIQVVPQSGPADRATTDLVHRIRDDRSALEGSSGAHSRSTCRTSEPSGTASYIYLNN